MLQQKSDHGQVSPTAGQQKGGQAIAFMVRQINGFLFCLLVIQYAFYGIVEIVPDQKVKQGKPIAAYRLQQSLFGAFCNTAFCICYNVWRDDGVPVNAAFKIIVPPGNEFALVNLLRGSYQQISKLFYVHNVLFSVYVYGLVHVWPCADWCSYDYTTGAIGMVGELGC